MNIASRITEVRNKLNMSQQMFAERVGITQGALSQLENKKSTLSLSTIINISKEFNIDCNWLLFGDGDNLHKEDASINMDASAHYNGRDINLIPLIDEEAHAGYISKHEDVDYINALDVYRIPGFESGNYRMFEIEGDSMMPTIHPREIVVTEKVDDRTTLENGTLTVVIAEEGIVAKRYYCYAGEPDNCILKSDNPDYKTYSIAADDVRELWEIKAKITNVLNTDLPANQERLQSIESDIMELKNKINQIID